MTPVENQLVQKSFAQLAPSGDAVAAMFYRELFARDPKLRKLFAVDLSQQRQKLMHVFGTAVAHLDRLEAIAPTVRDLGRRHAGYGVAAADYDTVAEALIATLERELGNDFTPELRTAWAACYWALAGEMKAGMDAARVEISAGERGP